MKTKKELNEIKEEVETLDEKLHELTEEELAQVTGGKSGGLSANTPVSLGTIIGAVASTVVK